MRLLTTPTAAKPKRGGAGVSASSGGAEVSASSGGAAVSVESSSSEGEEEKEQRALQAKSQQLQEKAAGRFGNLAEDETALAEEEAQSQVQDVFWMQLMGESDPDALTREDEPALFLRRLRRRGSK